jgi:pyruvate dehydrogenase E1 component alpha subunit
MQDRTPSGAGDSSVVARFEVRYSRLIAPDGTAVAPLPKALSDRTALTDLYRGMVLIRGLDAKAVSLQRTGRLGTYAVALGQEAVEIGVASAMAKDDVFVPAYRDNGALHWRGVTIEEVLAYWSGDERGSAFVGSPRDFPVNIPVGTQAAHAAGVAYAMKLRKEARVAVCMLGDGSMSKGDVYEAMNFAGVHKLPVVFVINNNGWAISVPLKLQTATPTLAQKAIAAGIPGEQVDGNDVIAVRARVEAAVRRARAGEGASLIEAITYRLGDHTTADDARRYRSDEEVRARWQEEPIARLRKYLVASGDWSKADEDALLAEVQAKIEAAVERFLAMAPRPPAAMFDHLYAILPHQYEGQRAELTGENTEAGGDDHG